MKIKRLTLLALGLTTVLCCFTSCQKDKDKNNNDNYVDYDDNDDDWGKGTYKNNGDSHDTFILDNTYFNNEFQNK